MEIVQTTDELLVEIKKNGLVARLINESEKEEHCAYQNCNDPVVLYVEGLIVCTKHAMTLMRCFMPDRKKI